MDIRNTLHDRAQAAYLAATTAADKYVSTPLAEGFHSFLEEMEEGRPPVIYYSAESPGGTAMWALYYPDHKLFKTTFAWLRDNLPPGATIKLIADGELKVTAPGFSFTSKIPAGIHIGELADAIREYENPILLPRPGAGVGAIMDAEFSEAPNDKPEAPDDAIFF